MGSKVAIAAASALVAFLVAATALEIHLRRSQTQVVAWVKGSKVVLDQDAGALVEQMPRGSRLVPGAHVLIKHHQISKVDVEMKINSLGFRGSEVAIPRPLHTTRILALGDSITWEDYLPEEQTYVRRLQDHLRQDGVHAEVINAGIGDVGTTEEMDLLAERGLAVQPDIVLLEFYLNDSRPSWGFSRELSHRGWLRRHFMTADALYKNLFFYSQIDAWDERFAWIRDSHALDWEHNRGAFQALVREARYDWGASWDPASWDVIYDNFKKLFTMAREAHFGVVVVAFPVVFQVASAFIDDVPQRMLGEISRRFGFEILDLLPVLRGNKRAGYFFDQCHLRPEANEVVASAISQFLEAKSIVHANTTNGLVASGG